MAVRQKYMPNLGVVAVRGWCLKYVDDGGKAPNRRPTARAAYLAEKAARRISVNPAPINIWVIGYLIFHRGPFIGLDHVFYMKNKGGGKYEIRDSEVRAGARSAYPNIDAVLAWFGAYTPSYAGWSMITDGRRYAESYTPTTTTPQRVTKRGTATVIVSELNVRNSPNARTAAIVARYKKGAMFNYDSYIKINGFTWLSYRSYSGVRRYVAQGNSTTKFVKGGV